MHFRSSSIEQFLAFFFFQTFKSVSILFVILWCQGPASVFASLLRNNMPLFSKYPSLAILLLVGFIRFGSAVPFDVAKRGKLFSTNICWSRYDL
jgi:hypothetical protein